MTPAMRDPPSDEMAQPSGSQQRTLDDSALLRHSKVVTTSTAPRSCNVAAGMNISDLAHSELSDLFERCSIQRETQPTIYREKFPMACRSLLHQLEGNHYCVDCNARDPEWAAISYGALVCIRCSGIHRSMGVAISQVRSVSMDHWTHKEVVLMMEGGNAQLKGFFARHALTKDAFEKQQQQQHKHDTTDAADPKNNNNKRRNSLTPDNVTSLRYKTKAALFYKSQLEAHVEKLIEDPNKPYKGRARRKSASSGQLKSELGLRSNNCTGDNAESSSSS